MWNDLRGSGPDESYEVVRFVNLDDPTKPLYESDELIDEVVSWYLSRLRCVLRVIVLTFIPTGN